MCLFHARVRYCTLVYNHYSKVHEYVCRARVQVLTVVVATVILGMVQAQTLTISQAVNGKTELRSFTDDEVRTLIRNTDFLTILLNCSPPAQRRAGICASDPILREVISKYKYLLTCMYVCMHL